MDQQIAHMDQQITHIYQQIAHSDQQIAHIYQQIAHSDQQIAHKYQQIAHSDQQNANMDNKKAPLEVLFIDIRLEVLYSEYLLAVRSLLFYEI